MYLYAPTSVWIVLGLLVIIGTVAIGAFVGNKLGKSHYGDLAKQDIIDPS